MGVDAEIVFTLDAKPTVEKLRQMQYELMERFGKEFFFCERYRNGKLKTAEPFLAYIDPADQECHEPFGKPVKA